MLELSNEVMAGLALAVFWIHTLLIAAAAIQDLRDLLRLRRSLRPLTGIVRSGRAAGVLARNCVEQVGRGKGDGRVYFSDAGTRSELLGGEIELDGGRVISLAAAQVPVWPGPAQRLAAAQPSSPSQIAEVEPQARRAAGWRREVSVEIREGDRVWIGGAETEPLLISAIDPRAWLLRRSALIVAFVLGSLALAGVCTALALWPPVFGTVSMLGAAAALGFFLGVQPLGVSLNEAVRTPDRAYLRGHWG